MNGTISNFNKCINSRFSRRLKKVLRVFSSVLTVIFSSVDRLLTLDLIYRVWMATSIVHSTNVRITRAHTNHMCELCVYTIYSTCVLLHNVSFQCETYAFVLYDHDIIISSHSSLDPDPTTTKTHQINETNAFVFLCVSSAHAQFIILEKYSECFSCVRLIYFFFFTAENIRNL